MKGLTAAKMNDCRWLKPMLMHLWRTHGVGYLMWL
jgi:hypothetical protein